MAISALDVRDARVSRRVSPAASQRVPAAALGAGLLAVLEGVGLLAAALTGLDGVLSSPLRPALPLLAAALIGLSGWIVLAAGSGVALIDGSARRTFVGLALAEIALIGVLPVAIPLPALVWAAVALPVGKLLLAGAPSARQWVAQGPRVREARPDPVARHRLLATLTLGAIGAGLVALTVLAPVAQGDGGDLRGTVSSVVYTP